MRAYCFSSDLTKSSFSSSGKKDALAALRFDSISLLVLTLKRFWHFWYSIRRLFWKIVGSSVEREQLTSLSKNLSEE